MVLVSLQWANNETGVVQPMPEIAAAVAEARQAGQEVWLHTDADAGGGQAAGGRPRKRGGPIELRGAQVSTAPKGVGGLWIRRGVRLRAQQIGGPQETERRGGTENVPGVLGLGVAADQAQAFLDDPARRAAIAMLRDRLEAKVQSGLAESGLAAANVNSGEVERLWKHGRNLGFRGLEAEAILLGLSERGVCASAGAACSSGSLEPSPVLRAMGVEEAVAHGSIRLSLSRFHDRG